MTLHCHFCHKWCPCLQVCSSWGSLAPGRHDVGIILADGNWLRLQLLHKPIPRVYHTLSCIAMHKWDILKVDLNHCWCCSQCSRRIWRGWAKMRRGCKIALTDRDSNLIHSHLLFNLDWSTNGRSTVTFVDGCDNLSYTDAAPMAG